MAPKPMGGCTDSQSRSSFPVLLCELYALLMHAYTSTCYACRSYALICTAAGSASCGKVGQRRGGQRGARQEGGEATEARSRENAEWCAKFVARGVLVLGRSKGARRLKQSSMFGEGVRQLKQQSIEPVH